jgi:hypothetical protein
MPQESQADRAHEGIVTKKEGFIVRTRSESYLRTAERVHQHAETALSPQERDLLLAIERSLRQLAEIEDWQDEVERAMSGLNAPQQAGSHWAAFPTSTIRGTRIVKVDPRAGSALDGNVAAHHLKKA